MTLLSAVLGLLLYTVAISSGALLNPESFVASEGSGKVNFICSSAVFDRTPSAIVIFVNGIDPAEEERRIRGIETILINSTTRLLSIESSAINNNTELSCLAVFVDADGEVQTQHSLTSLLQVQGVLSPPTELRTAELTANIQRLSWTPPFTLDISGIERDITGYRVCFSISELEVLMCNFTQDPFFNFLNSGFTLEFNVTALNVVGESNITTFTRQACSLSGTETNALEVDVIVSENDLGMHSFRIKLQQPPEVACYDAYRLEVTTADSENVTLSVGPLLPILVDPSIQVLELEEIEGLQTNTVFFLEITAVNINGERALSDRFVFGTYDVQAVSLAPQAAGLLVSCAFLERSAATGCEVTLCRREGQGQLTQCISVILDPATPSTLVGGLAAGTYVVTRVIEVEGDGDRTEVNVNYIQGLLEAMLTTTMVTPPITSPGLVGELSTRATEGVGVIVGSVVGVLAVVLLGLIVAIILILLWKKRATSELNSCWSNRKAIDNDQREEFSWTESTTKETNEAAQGAAVKVTTVNLVNPDLEPTPRQQQLSPHHRPTSPFYTDVMSGPDSVHTSCPPLDTSPPPYLPPKKGSKHSSVISTLSEPSTIILPPPEFGGPLQNLSQEEIHEVHFTSPSHGRSKESFGSKASAQISQESLISQGSQFSVLSGANLTYAEIEHLQKTRKPKIVPRDKSTVLYSEIRVDEIPPVLPQKRSRRTASNASSHISIDMDSNSSRLGFRV